LCLIQEKKWKYNGTVHQLFVEFEKAYDNKLTEIGVPMKLVSLIKMCLNETYSKICIDKNV